MDIRSYLINIIDGMTHKINAMKLIHRLTFFLLARQIIQAINSVIMDEGNICLTVIYTDVEFRILFIIILRNKLDIFDFNGQF